MNQTRYLQNPKPPSNLYEVCGWDPSNPEKSKPFPIDDLLHPLKGAIALATTYNQEYQNRVEQLRISGRPICGEEEYFVIDREGRRGF